MPAPELLEGPSGPGLGERGRSWSRAHPRTIAVALVTAALAVAAAAATWWWLRPAAVRVVDVAVVGPARVVPDPENGAAPGALGVPAPAALPAMRAEVRIANDGDEPATLGVTGGIRDGVRIAASPTGAAAAPGGITVSPGDTAAIAVTLSPTDCAAPADAVGTASLAASLVTTVPVTSSPDATSTLGEFATSAVPVEPAPAEALAEAAATLCAGSPQLRLARLDERAPSRRGIESARLLVLARPTPDRIVVTPLDGIGRRGLGAVSVPPGRPVDVTWEVSSSASPPRVQVFAVRDGIATPYLLDVPAT